MTALAWTLVFASFAAFLIALNVGPSCATTAGPYCAAVFFFSWVWLVYRYDRKDHR